MRVRSFRPIENPRARVLILGTVPSLESLRMKQFYAHPQNAFWRIIGEVLGFAPGTPYADRKKAVAASHIAIWDVLKSCTRPGSMDSDIEDPVPNDFDAFLRRHARIRKVCFNGATAERLFRQHVLPDLAAASRLDFVRLPSTSPANASIPYRRKLQMWRRHLTSERR